jgi:hypothetical protein
VSDEYNAIIKRNNKHWITIEPCSITGNQIKESICGFYQIHNTKDGFKFYVKDDMRWELVGIVIGQVYCQLIKSLYIDSKTRLDPDFGWVKYRENHHSIAKEIVKRLGNCQQLDLEKAEELGIIIKPSVIAL